MPSYSETLDYIFKLRGGEIDLKLHRVEQALSLFGHPERSYPAFHIAGTNGKGSTAAMLHRILTAQGYRVALYTSPHMISFTERIRVGHEEISQGKVVELAELIRNRCAGSGIQLTYFEFVTTMALVYFSWRKVDLAVVEVGLGGRLDATNVVLPLVSLITTISRDHEAYLGSDLPSIAREKGGIIKEHIPVVCGALPLDVRTVLAEIAESHASPIYFLSQDFSIALKNDGIFDYTGLEWKFRDLFLALKGDYQRGNAALALAAVELARERFPVTERAVREGLAQVSWPGRLEEVLCAPRVILDGAHNPEGVAVLVKEIEAMVGPKKVRLLFAAMEDKDWRTMLKQLSAVAGEVVLTRVPIERSADPGKLAEAVPQGLGVNIRENPVEAIKSLLSSGEPDQPILVTGSLYLLGEIRPFLGELAENSPRECSERPNLTR